MSERNLGEELALAQARVEIERLKVEHQHEINLEMFRSVIASGQGAIKSAFLLNGGAAVALLAFLAHLMKTESDKVADFSFCLLLVGGGALAVAVTSGLTYLTQWLFNSESSYAPKAGFVCNIFSIVFVLISYGLFLWGLLEAYRTFVAYG